MACASACETINLISLPLVVDLPSEWQTVQHIHHISLVISVVKGVVTILTPLGLLTDFQVFAQTFWFDHFSFIDRF